MPDDPLPVLRACPCGATFPVTPGRPGRPRTLCDECRSPKKYRDERAARRSSRGECLYCPEATVQPALPGVVYCGEHRDYIMSHSRRRAVESKGITEEHYAELLASQGGVCAVCQEPPGDRRLAIDHDHSCCPGELACGSCVRGLLCSGCNLGLGYFQDRPSALRAAADYLERVSSSAPSSQTSSA